MHEHIYLDYNATTQVHPSVLKNLNRYFNTYGNPSSLYGVGRKAKELLETSRERIGSYLKVKAEQIIFTSSATEANNNILKSQLLLELKRDKKSHIITSTAEHSAIYKSVEQLTELGIEVSYVNVNENCQVDPSDVEQLIRPDTTLISIMLANNEVGTIQPIQEIVKIAHANGCLVHTDATQALGKMALDLKELGVDYASFSGHKCYAPKGIGIMYVKDDQTLIPLLTGGAQERTLRAGTENIALAAAFADALQILKDQQESYWARVEKLKEYLWNALKSELKDIYLNSASNGLNNTLNISFLGVEGSTLAIKLDLAGLSISTGSACSVGAIEPSHVLQAMGLSEERVNSAVRISLGLFTTQQEVENAVQIIVRAVTQLRDQK